MAEVWVGLFCDSCAFSRLNPGPAVVALVVFYSVDRIGLSPLLITPSSVP